MFFTLLLDSKEIGVAKMINSRGARTSLRLMWGNNTSKSADIPPSALRQVQVMLKIVLSEFSTN